MAWDGSGNFTRTNGTHTGSAAWGDDRDAGDNILASRHDTHDQDLADGIAACLTKNNETKPTANFKPNADNSYDLGSSALRWRRAFITQYIGDGSGNELLSFTATASAVNELTLANAATGNRPTLSATGGDTNIGITIAPKGTGSLLVGTMLSYSENTGGGQSALTFSGASSANNIIQLINSHASGSVVLQVQINGGGSGDARIEVGAGTGDSWLVLSVNATTSWYVGVDNSASDRFIIGTGAPGIADKIVVDTGGSLYIGDTANAKATGPALTINQAGSDDEILSLKSSDVAHGVTTISETDTYGFMAKIAGATGGLEISGIRETGATAGMYLVGYADAADTTASTSAIANVNVHAFSFSGTGVANMAANALVFGVRAQVGGSLRSLFFVDEDGDLFVDGSTTLTAFDAYHDSALLRALVRETSAPETVALSEFDQEPQYRRSDLVECGVLTAPTDGGGAMRCITRNVDILNGAAWQHETRIRSLDSRLESVERALFN